MIRQRVLIASKHQRFRHEISRLVQVVDPSIEIVGEAATSFDVLVSVGELRPDLVLLDLGLRPGNGLDLVKHIHRLSPATAVVMISNEPDADYQEAAIQAGALDYVNVLDLTTMLPAALALVNGHINSPETTRTTTRPALLDVTPPQSSTPQKIAAEPHPP